MKPIIVFDFDGTIANSWPTLLKVINEQLQYYGMEKISLSTLRRQSVKELLHSYGLSPLELLQFRNHILSHIDTVPLFDGVIEELTKLSTKYDIVIISKNKKSVIQKSLPLSVSKIIQTGIRSKITYLKKYKGCYYVGDEIDDIRDAKKAGVIPIAVTWGLHKEQMLKKEAPFKILYTVNEIGTL